MVPASVLLRSFSGFTLERNFDYARLNKANLFQKSIGETVTITRTDRASGKVTRDIATIIAAGEAPGSSNGMTTERGSKNIFLAGVFWALFLKSTARSRCFNARACRKALCLKTCLKA